MKYFTYQKTTDEELLEEFIEILYDMESCSSRYELEKIRIQEEELRFEILKRMKKN